MSNRQHHAPTPHPPPLTPPPPLPPPPPPPPGLVHPAAPHDTAYRPPAPRAKNGQSIAALVLGCCSLLFYWTIIVPGLAIVFGVIAVRAQKDAGQNASGMAIAGIVLGSVFLLLGVLLWAAIA